MQLLIFVFLITINGCTEINSTARQVLGSTWHSKYNWQAEDYFVDPLVVKLCNAIQADDLEEIDRLVKAGADVNAKGTDNMTPLLWAFPDNKLARFTKLLEHGADPNVIINSRFGTRGMVPGDSVMTMAAKTSFEGYLKAVLDHGGDPNLKTTKFHETPLHLVISSGGDKTERIKLLLDAGADINALNGLGITPVMYAAGYGAQYDLALFLLEQGADPEVHEENELRNFVEMLAHYEWVRKESWTENQRADFRKLEQWLLDHGWDVDAARADHKRWGDWIRSHGTVKAKYTLGYKERKARLEAKLKAE